MSAKEAKNQSSGMKRSTRLLTDDDTKDMCPARTCRYFSCTKTELLPARFLRRATAKMANGIEVLFTRKTAPLTASDAKAGRSSKPIVNPVDSHRTEDIEDCIEFIYSNSSLARSKSVSANRPVRLGSE